jgi:hypothetical protein
MSKTSTISKASKISNVSKKRSHDHELDPEATPPPTKIVKTTKTNITKTKLKPRVLIQKKRTPPMLPVAPDVFMGIMLPPKPAPEPVFKAVFDTATPPFKLIQESNQEIIQEPIQEPIQKTAQKRKATPKKAAPKPTATPSNRPSRNRKAPERLAEQIEASKPKPTPRKVASKVFDPEYVTTNANSRLCKADVYVRTYSSHLPSLSLCDAKL